MIRWESRALVAVKANANSIPNHKATGMTFFRETISFEPQNLDMSTEAPILTPVHRKVNRVMNWLAREEANRTISPKLPSIMVSTKFTPVVMTLGIATGRAIFTMSL